MSAPKVPEWVDVEVPWIWDDGEQPNSATLRGSVHAASVGSKFPEVTRMRIELDDTGEEWPVPNSLRDEAREDLRAAAEELWFKRRP